jgi:hypothetical protein
MVFPKNNLPTDSQPWTRDVEKRVENLESTFRSAEVNNVTRDSQALSQIRRLDAAVTDVTQAAADAAAAAATAQAAIDGLGSLDEATSTYKINAANVTVGTLSGDRISGGEIIGTTLKTGTTGRRVEIQSTNTSYFDESGNFTGRILGIGTGNGATLELTSGGSGEIQIWSSGVNIYGGSSTISVTTNGVDIFGDISGDELEISGNIAAGSITNNGSYTGNGFPTIAANTVSGTSFPANTFIATNGNMARKTDASERRLKENINNFEFDTDAFINVNPVTFNYKRDAVSTDEQAESLNVGFILDDFEGAGLSEFLVYQAEGDDFKQLRYDLLAIYLHKVVQTQQQAIKSLEARIEALEGGV